MCLKFEFKRLLEKEGASLRALKSILQTLEVNLSFDTTILTSGNYIRL